MAKTWYNPGWKAFVKLYQEATPVDKRLPSPGLLAAKYYDATMAGSETLDKVRAISATTSSKIKAAMAFVIIDALNGQLQLDEDRRPFGPL